MSDLLNSNSNYKYTCSLCHKQYTKKSSLDKHTILCEFKLKTKAEHKIEEEEIGDTPNHEQLVKIVYELAFKYAQMEEKLENMQKWVDRKKKKINVCEWLNKNVKATVGYLEWVNMFVDVKPEHFEYLMENNLFQTIQHVFEFNLTKEEKMAVSVLAPPLGKVEEFVVPMRCFSQKQNVFYICEKNNGVDCWRQMELDDLVKLLKKIQNKFLEELTSWRKKNHEKIDESDKVAEQFNKAVLKLMNMSFTQDATLSRMRNGFYNYLKTDLKCLIEYDFEF
jgi:hypothetical protein